MLSTADAEVKTQISHDTLAFSQLEYDLKLALKSSTARITNCWMLTNPHLSDSFTRISQDQLTLFSWVDSATLVGGNTEEDVLKRGFHFVPPSQGMSFTVGSFTPKGSCFLLMPGAPQSDQGSLHKALLCEILVGRSYAIEKSAVDQTDIPPGYKSLYVQDDSRPARDYCHEYFIKHTGHAIPRYLVQFEYDPVLELTSRQKPKCDDCEKEYATVYCDADKAYLCKSCDANLHKTKIAKLHTRKPIGEVVARQ
ncbi:hypothetical protein HDU91_002055 [Kappamyces sp. JEL0680]|nr:hypothetical protein HDU91_002055 [Kappamyces sp. JEL0680]